MLLRLLPAPTASQPTPPTILFTLPLPVNPYTSKSLPLPPMLQSHRSACHQEGLECSNALLGEKSSWISGIVDEVTFCVSAGRITVHLIDGTVRPLPISRPCMATLAAVIAQVQLSFAAPVTPPASPVSAVGPSRRSPTNLICSILSPLLSPNPVRPAQPKQAQTTSRVHRRQARSLLVDAYRLHVQTVLRATLPSNYLGWVIQSELEVHQTECTKVRTQVDGLLKDAGVLPAARPNFRATLLAARLARHALGPISEAGSSSVCSDSSSEDESGPSTPATSNFGHSTENLATPLSQLSTLPNAATLPLKIREEYTALVSDLSSMATRMVSLRKRRGAMDREEGRRSWLESMEASRMQDRAQRRAWSNNASTQMTNYANSRPVKLSSLWRVEGTEQEEEVVACHPAMMDDFEMDSCSLSGSEEEDVFSADIITRPLSPSAYASIPPRPRLVSSGSISSMGSSSSDESDDMDTDSEPAPRKSPRMWTREIMDNGAGILGSIAEPVEKEPWGASFSRNVVIVEA